MSDCEHNYQYQGVVWSLAEWSMPGSGAREVRYEDRYYCTRCLNTVDKSPRYIGNSYGKTIEGAYPK